MALGFGDVPLEIVIRASNQLAPGLAAAGAQLKAFQAEVGRAGGQLSLPGIGGGGAAQLGLLGAIGPTLAIGAGVAAIAGTVAAGKSLVDTYRAEQTALADLKQAYASVNLPFAKYGQQVEDFINKNERYIRDTNQVREGYAYLTRAGLDQTSVQKAVNDALDLSILRGENFSVTLERVLLATQGNSRGLRDLGITTAEYNSIMKGAGTETDKVNKLLDILAAKGKNGRDTTDALQQSQDRLNHQWERLSNQVGPGALNTLAGIEGHMANIVSDVVDHNLAKGMRDFGDSLGNLNIGPLSSVAQLIGFIGDRLQQIQGSAASSGHWVTGPHGNQLWVPSAVTAPAGQTGTGHHGPVGL